MMDIQTSRRGSRVRSLSLTKTAKKIKITERCRLIVHDESTKEPYVYGLKFTAIACEILPLMPPEVVNSPFVLRDDRNDGGT